MKGRKSRGLNAHMIRSFVFCAGCLFLIMFTYAAAAEDLSVSLSWTDMSGTVVSSTARRLDYDQDAW